MPSDQAHRADATGIELLNTLRSEERKAAVSRVASTLSHALGTPLNVIAGRAAMIGMEGMSAEEIRSNAGIIEQQVRGIANMLRQVLSFARDGRSEAEACDARELAAHALDVFRPLASARGIVLKLEAMEPMAPRLQVRPVLQVVTNLVALGIELEPPEGGVSLGVSIEHAVPPAREKGRVAAGQYIRFQVKYANAQLPWTNFDTVYEPWLDGASAHRDVALVLAVSYGVAREHRGWVDSIADSGSTAFVVNWPVNHG